MGEGDLRVLRGIYAEWSRGDYSNVDWADPEIELVDVDGPAPGTWRGLAEIAEGWRGILQSWKDFSTDAEEYIELDDGRVLVLTRNHGRGKVSDVELDKMPTRGANLFTLRDERVTRIDAYWDRENAFEDLGIDPGALGSSLPDGRGARDAKRPS
jgi:ketosteroid isomerase-like protein